MVNKVNKAKIRHLRCLLEVRIVVIDTLYIFKKLVLCKIRNVDKSFHYNQSEHYGRHLLMDLMLAEMSTTLFILYLSDKMNFFGIHSSSSNFKPEWTCSVNNVNNNN